MFFRFTKIASLIAVGVLIFQPPSIIAQESSSSYKVLASKKSGLNISTVKDLIDKGDKAMSLEDFDEARENFDKARLLTKQLLGFYREINGAFRGMDARIPREMDQKGREGQVLLSKINLRLATLFRRMNQPEVAVPLLVEVVRLMTPAKEEGQRAYQELLELGFVETPYAVAR
tara:strand:+ start:580 stop:1101 length:522 start_codon:yes stop_codon:yes gene_type:complete